MIEKAAPQGPTDPLSCRGVWRLKSENPLVLPAIFTCNPVSKDTFKLIGVGSFD